MSPTRRQPSQEPDLPRIPVRLSDLPTPTPGGFFRADRTPPTWPRDSDPPLEPRLAADDSGPRTGEFSVAELASDVTGRRRRGQGSRGVRNDQGSEPRASRGGTTGAN